MANEEITHIAPKVAEELYEVSDGWAVGDWIRVADIEGDDGRWERHHTLVIQHLDGRRYGIEYSVGLTENQDSTYPWKGDGWTGKPPDLVPVKRLYPHQESVIVWRTEPGERALGCEHRRYAQDTGVSTDQSKRDIERVLGRYGATAFGYLAEGDQVLVLFEIDKRRVGIRLPMPDRKSREITRTPVKGLWRDQDGIERTYEQAIRQRWRALLLIITAKLEAVKAGISTVEREFLADVMLPTGATVGQWVQPQLDEIYTSGTMPALLPGGGHVDP